MWLFLLLRDPTSLKIASIELHSQHASIGWMCWPSISSDVCVIWVLSKYSGLRQPYISLDACSGWVGMAVESPRCNCTWKNYSKELGYAVVKIFHTCVGTWLNYTGCWLSVLVKIGSPLTGLLNHQTDNWLSIVCWLASLIIQQSARFFCYLLPKFLPWLNKVIIGLKLDLGGLDWTWFLVICIKLVSDHTGVH